MVNTDVLLKTYTGEPLHVLGEMQAQVVYQTQEAGLPLLVVAGNGPALWGRNWLGKVRLNWNVIKQVSQGCEPLINKYSDIFRNELGTLKGIKVKLMVPENTPTKLHKPRPVPYAIRGAIERDLENLGVIEKTNYSDWAAPIVVVPKSDGTIRICSDYKVTINSVLQVDQYPVPKAEDLFATLAGGEKFTKLDLSQAYQQVLLEEDSRKLVTINTHKGLYQFKRLPFGVASAPAIFQQTMEKILQGLQGVTVYIDDILITGRSDAEDLDALEKVLRRLSEYGLRLKTEKCSFMKPSVEYLGYIVDKDGLHTTPAKIEAITKAPEPRNVQELRSFLGLVNYYGKFICHLSTLIQPLNRLLCQNVEWKWSTECQQVFQELKAQLSSSEVLVHYDPSLPLKLDCDASSYGVGAVLSHVYSDGTERPVAYASRTLSKTERGYPQLEKEALSLVYGVKMFHQFILGRHFTLVTDHKPLTTILSPKKGLPTLAAARLQRWAITLAAYKYDIEFRSTDKHCNANGFSRLPLQVQETEEHSVFNLRQIEILPVDTGRLRRATQTDPILSQVYRYVQGGWPSVVDSQLKPYIDRKGKLTTEAGCLLWGMRVLVPESCREDVLREHPWSWPDGPWKRVHVDFAGPFLGSMLMVIVDAYSKWLEVVPMSTTTTEKTLEVLRSMFARYGLPEQLVSDNGPQFISSEFETFVKANGVKHIRTSPYHPASNGEAERFVQTFKKAMKASCQDAGTLNMKLWRFLLSCRNTPSCTTGVSPAELFLKRPLRTRLDLLRPSVSRHVHSRQADQKLWHDARSKHRLFDVGQSVLVRNLRGGPKWVQGTIIEQTGPVSFKVQVDDQVWRRHSDQLLECSTTSTSETNVEDELLPTTSSGQATRSSVPTPSDSESPSNDEPITTDMNRSTTSVTSESKQYPQRIRKPPDRLSH